MATVTTPNTADDSDIVSTLSGYASVSSVTIAGISIDDYSFNGTDTLTIPARNYYLSTGTGSAPLIGSDVTIQVDGLDSESAAASATDTFTITPATDWVVVELTSIDYTDITDAINDEFGITVAVGDVFYYDQSAGDDATTGGTEIGADALFEYSESFSLILLQGGSSTAAASYYAAVIFQDDLLSTGTLTAPATKYRRFPWQQWVKKV